jgi:predicted MFS family arabinose efflux permease
MQKHPQPRVTTRSAAGPQSNKSPRRVYPALVILLLIYAISYMDRQLVAILIEPIKRDLGMSDTAAGLLYGFAFVAFFSVLGIPIARLADRTNRSRIIIVSVMLFSAMTAAFSWASTFWQLVLARVGVGIGEAGTTPASQSIIADLFPPERRATAMAVFAVGLHIGILLGFLIGGVIGQALGWRTTFLIAGSAGIVVALVASRVLKEPARTDAARVAANTEQLSFIATARKLSRSTTMCHLFVGGTVANLATTALLAWIPSFLIRSHDLSLSTTGALLAFTFGFLGGFGTILGGTLADRLGALSTAWRLRCIVIAFAVAAPCWMLALVSQSDLAALVGLLCAGTLVAFHIGPTFAVVQTLSPSNTRALAASLLILCANLIGVGLGPLLIGVLSDAWMKEDGVHSLRNALMVAPPLFLWAAAHYEIAARALAADLRSVNEHPPAEQSLTPIETTNSATA